jgi:hypothetical protein
MDEVERRRRRTRERNATTATPDVRANDGHNVVAGKSARPHIPDRAAPVTPADIADRTGGERAVPDQQPSTSTDRPLPFDAHSGHGHDERDGERGLRGLVGGGSTQVSVTAAMRARDAARPSDAEIAKAEATLTIVHRGWVPRDPA